MDVRLSVAWEPYEEEKKPKSKPNKDVGWDGVTHEFCPPNERELLSSRQKRYYTQCTDQPPTPVFGRDVESPRSFLFAFSVAIPQVELGPPPPRKLCSRGSSSVQLRRSGEEDPRGKLGNATAPQDLLREADMSSDMAELFRSELRPAVAFA
ncbi:hypothetical protein NL676_024487 [Syzygium grande]|nr:hypothetical protein NL676_024487 [Syzygium grande]